MSPDDDAQARVRALTAHDETLLVEASAGTGKTALLAGRICLMLAADVAPNEIAAITFTESAAGELGARVRGYVDELLSGRVPRPLQAVLPAGLSTAQQSALAAAFTRLDDLTLITIHGFCQALIRGYAVEADLDPGATVLDADAQAALFAQVFDEWLGERLNGDFAADDPIAVLSRQDPRGFDGQLKALARLRIEQRRARPATPDLSLRPDLDFDEAAAAFLASIRDHLATPTATAWRDDVEALIAFYTGALATLPSFARLWALAHPPQLKSMRAKSHDLVRPRDEAAWGRILGSQGAVAAQALGTFEALDEAYRTLSAAIAGTLMSRLSDALNPMLAAYAARKRAAALLDFDDLLELAGSLLRGHPDVRDALAQRFRRVLVDEFQDTDALQCEILFRLAGAEPVESWDAADIRPGALFLVGDPKQSLYAFRGAEIVTYQRAKRALEEQPGAAVLTVSRNFRSAEGILRHVNDCFTAPLNAPGQSGYAPLAADRETARHDLPCAVKLTIPCHAGDYMPQLRDAEAERVAQACARLVGGMTLATAEGARPLRAGDIVLLAPAATDLWRYERALRAQGLPFVSEAGKALYSRQETQDFVALVRTLADPTDTVALGALLRGPLVGFTDEALVEATAALPAPLDGGARRISLRTPIDHFTEGPLRDRMADLQAVRARMALTTPAVLLAEAIERLRVRATLALRDARTAAAADANLDELLARAGRYGVRGMRRLAHDLQADWSRGDRAREGQPDADENAIEIVTVHHAKGREWPVVIPINAMGTSRRRDPMLHSPAENRLYWKLGDIQSPELAAALAADDAANARERTRLLYVACTRAEDLLIVPHVATAGADAYSRAADLGFDRLPELPLDRLQGRAPPAKAPADGAQDATTFAAEQAALQAAATPIRWRTPSAHDADRLESTEEVSEGFYDLEALVEPVAGGRIRGLILHKLMEEVLAEDLPDTLEALQARAGQLNDELASEADAQILHAEELARTVLRTLAVPEVAELRDRLVPEAPVYGMLSTEAGADPVGGRADAIAFADGAPEVVVDWKSDQAPTDHQTDAHVDQLRLYLAVTGAHRGLIVYMSLGFVRHVQPPAALAI